MKLLPSRCTLCVHNTTMHGVPSFITSYVVFIICNLHFWQNDLDLLRATAVTREWNGYRNEGQHRKLTLAKKILPLLLPGLEPATFRSRVQRFNHWAILAPQDDVLSLILRLRVVYVSSYRPGSSEGSKHPVDGTLPIAVNLMLRLRESVGYICANSGTTFVEPLFISVCC